MRILLVHTSDWLGHPVPSRLHRIFEILADHNEIYVPRFNLYSEKKRETRAIVYEINDLKVRRLASYYMLNAYKHYKAVKWIVEENQIDMAVISNLLAGYMAVKALGNKVRTIFDLPDHFPSTATGYYFDANSPLGRLSSLVLEKLLKMTLQRVNYTVTCSHALQAYVRRLGVKNVSVIPNGVDEFFFTQKFNAKEIREKYGMEKDLVVGYIGSIEFYLDMLPLLKAIKRLNKHHKVKFLLVGSRLTTGTVEKVWRQIRSLGIEKDVVWLGFVPYQQVPSYIAAMDICTIPFNNSYQTAYYSAPIKLLEYLALEKTVLATPVPEIVYLAKKYVNFAVTAKDYVNVIEDYGKNYEKYEEKAKQGRKLVMQMTWTKMAQRYEHLLNMSAS